MICPGFGQRGIEGKIVAAHYCRTHNIPTFGICLGMQMMVIEFARNVLGYKDANSREMDEKTPHNVIDIMEEQKNITNMGGTMRLGTYQCQLRQNSRTFNIYGKQMIEERHRHRYEFNNSTNGIRAQRNAVRGEEPRVELGGDCGDTQSEMVYWHAIPSRIPVNRTPPTSAIHGFY